MDDHDTGQGDICRVCRSEAQPDRPLFYPCICTGSIKYIHQDCLTQWMRYSQKELCELCGHRFTFQPIYSPDMPRVLPLRVILGGILAALSKTAKSWFHNSLVALAWFGIVPLTAYRTYRCLFRGTNFDMLLSLPFDIFSTENLASDAFRGCFVVTCTLLSFVGLVWLREQILHGGGPDWLEHDDNPIAVNDADDNADAAQVANAPIPVQEPRPGAGAGPVAFNRIDENANTGNDGGRDREVGAGIDSLSNARNDNNNNDDAPIDVPMDNAAPAPINPSDQEGDNGNANEAQLEANAELQYGPELPIHMNGGADNNLNELNAQDPQVPGAIDHENDNDNDNDIDNDEPNWNPMEWDRAAEELTWERLLGLDGSLVFLEHVFWTISLNTMFIFTFAFSPYCMGYFILSLLDLLQPDKPLIYFHGLITTLFGYCCIGLILVVLHFFARLFRMRRVRWLIGLCYIVVKVSLLSVIEIGGLPLVCGWWLDICSLPLFDASIKDRITSFNAAPGTSLFVHWMFGMVYLYYFAAFISLLREVLRPDVLWFLRNLNDPNFSPIQEMIHLPILKHLRRLISSATIFGSAVLLMLWLPIRLLKSVWPSFLPYTLSGDSEVNELNLQLLLLQIIVPSFFEQSHTRIWLKGLLRLWCICVAWILGIRSYLLGNEQTENDPQTNTANAQQGNPNNEQANQNNQENNEQINNVEVMPLLEAPIAPNIDADIGEIARPMPARAPPPPPQAAPVPLIAHQERNLAAMHQAIIQRNIPLGYQPYDKPTFFALRLCGLLFFICISLVIASLLTLSIPVWIGRKIIAVWSVGNHINSNGSEITARPHELYTAALGIYLCWIISRGIAIAINLLPQGRAAIVKKIQDWLLVAAVYALPLLFVVLMIGIIPLLFGLLLDLMLVVPFRVPPYMYVIHFLWQDWALGVLYTKIAIALTLMGPDWHMKRAIERAYHDGLRDINLQFLVWEIAYPVITFFGLALAIPYVIAHSIVPLIISNAFEQMVISNCIYSFSFLLIMWSLYINSKINQAKQLYVNIKADKYLVGKRLINYEHRKRQQEEAEAVKATEAAKAAETIQATAILTGNSNNNIINGTDVSNVANENIQIDNNDLNNFIHNNSIGIVATNIVEHDDALLQLNDNLTSMNNAQNSQKHQQTSISSLHNDLS